MNWSDFEETIKKFDARFSETPDDEEDFDPELLDMPDMDAPRYREFLRKRSATGYGRLFTEFRDFVVPGVLDWYAGSSEEEREAALQLLGSHPSLRLAVWSLMSEYRWRLQKSSSEEGAATLRTLLLLAVLTGEYIERVETAHVLTSAWGDAEDGGLDPAEFFREAAGVAGRRKLTHGQSSSEILAGFEPYTYGDPSRS